MPDSNVRIDIRARGSFLDLPADAQRGRCTRHRRRVILGIAALTPSIGIEEIRRTAAYQRATTADALVDFTDSFVKQFVPAFANLNAAINRAAVQISRAFQTAGF